ncbi:pilus assembly protein PilM [Patescibacteria group bacterium]|nr:pilus assembly protein PilM [Patescibacteria group bacterium]
MDKNFFGKLFPWNFNFWARSQGVIGIDIGSSSIKIVQLKKENEQAVLETYGELAVGPYAKRLVGQVTQLSEEAMISALKDLLKESGANAKSAIIATPIRDGFVTILELPLVQGSQMDEVVKFEARKYIPVPLSDVEMDWVVLNSSSKSREVEEAGENGGDNENEILEKDNQRKNYKKTVSVLLAVVSKEIIQKYKNIVTGAGLKIKSFEIEIFSVWRSSRFRQITPVMTIDLGASSTKMSVVDNGVLMASHAVGRGAQELTDAISKSLGVGFQRAEEMKREIGLSPRPEYGELVGVLESVLNFIFSEAKQFMLAYRRKYNSSVGQVVMVGGGASLKGIVDVAVKELGVEVVTADPFSKTEYPPFLQEILKEIGPSFSVAIGLALKSL